VKCINLLLGIGIFTGLWIVTIPSLDGSPLHESLELILTAAIIIHLLVTGSWIAALARRYFSRRLHQSRFQFAIDSALLVAFLTMVLSRLTNSADMLAFTGAVNVRNSLWNPIHNLSTYAALILAVLHLATNKEWATAKS